MLANVRVRVRPNLRTLQTSRCAKLASGIKAYRHTGRGKLANIPTYQLLVLHLSENLHELSERPAVFVHPSGESQSGHCLTRPVGSFSENSPQPPEWFGLSRCGDNSKCLYPEQGRPEKYTFFRMLL
jgi:hypothetical protein